MSYNCLKLASSSLVIILCLNLMQRAKGDEKKGKNNKSAVEKKDDITTFDNHIYCKFQSYKYKCDAYSPERSYFYDLQRQECVLTEYGRCKNAYNNHPTRDLCKTACKDMVRPQLNTNLTSNIYCRFQHDFGDCSTYNPMFYYDINESRCKGFSYSGCGGNYNRFPSAQICMAVCDPVIQHKRRDGHKSKNK